MACHAKDKKMIGPAFKEIAAKYKGQKDAEAKLAQKIKKGGGGVWGPMPMPPNQVTDAEALELKPAEFYPEHQIDFRPSMVAVRINRESRTVRYVDGEIVVTDPAQFAALAKQTSK